MSTPDEGRQSPERGAASAARRSPNLFGDAFSVRPVRVQFNSNVAGISAGTVASLSSGSGGGSVGRTKLSDDNNPIPRDRFIFNADYYDNIVLGRGNGDVRRFSVGAEKTFFDQMASIEVRVPFASTLDDSVSGNGQTGINTELGNVYLALKTILWANENVTIATSLGVALPTAQDAGVNSSGTTIVRLDNQSIVLTPTIAAVFTPNDDFFVQLWAAYSFDVNGSPVLQTSGGSVPLQRFGRYNDPALAQFDVQVGYWVYRACDCSRRLQAVAPFVEVHYNLTVNEADVIGGNGFTFNTGGHLDEFTIAFGWISQFGDNFNVAAGVVLPLRGDSNRTFDYQIGLRGSYFFGATARSRSRAQEITSF